MRAIVLCFLICLCACNGPSYEDAPPRANFYEIQSALVDVNLALSQNDCAKAFNRISPLYQSINTNNDIRLAMASVYGCLAGLNMMDMLNDFITQGASLGSGGGIFLLMAESFPSTTNPVDDKKVTYSAYGTDALFSILQPGTQLLLNSQVNTYYPTSSIIPSFNPGSLSYFDRTSESNSFMVFMAMSIMGALMNRNGVNPANYNKTIPLPWTNATLMSGNGCTYASALLNFDDAINFFIQNVNSRLKNSFQAIQSLLNALDTVCLNGCAVCGGAVNCTSCPLSLRDRNSCTGLVTDENSCAGAALINFVNLTWP